MGKRCREGTDGKDISGRDSGERDARGDSWERYEWNGLWGTGCRRRLLGKMQRGDCGGRDAGGNCRGKGMREGTVGKEMRGEGGGTVGKWMKISTGEKGKWERV